MSRFAHLRAAILSVTVVAMISCGGGSGGDSPSTSLPPESALDVYVSGLNAALDAVIAEAGRAPQNPLLFGANLMFAHEAWIEQVPRTTLELYVDGLREAGAHRVDLNVGLFPWLDVGTTRGDETIAKYDAVVKRIRDAGLQLALNPQYSPQYHRLGSFDEWRTTGITLMETVARRYRPNVLVVVHEPTTMAARLGVTVSPAEWADFAEAAARAVKRVSPETRIGAGGLSSEIDYYREFAARPSIEVLTVDIYQLSQLPVYTDMATIARQNNKPVYIEETWRPPFTQASPGDTLDTVSLRGVGDVTFKDLDAKWLHAISLYAGALGMEAMTAVWSQTFFKYTAAGGGNALDPAYIAETVQAIENGERTDTFFAYQNLVRSAVPLRLEQ